MANSGARPRRHIDCAFSLAPFHSMPPCRPHLAAWTWKLGIVLCTDLIGNRNPHGQGPRRNLTSTGPTARYTSTLGH